LFYHFFHLQPRYHKNTWEAFVQPAHCKTLPAGNLLPAQTQLTVKQELLFYSLLFILLNKKAITNVMANIFEDAVQIIVNLYDPFL
jgi:hypothetical protein